MPSVHTGIGDKSQSFQKTYGKESHVSDVDNRAYRYITIFLESGRSKLKMRYRPLAVVTTAQFVIMVC